MLVWGRKMIPSGTTHFPALPRSFFERMDAWRLRWHGLEFAILGMLATALAFYVATLFHLKTPYTAAITVWVVVNTKPGHVISKSFYRVIGTLIGGSFAIFLIQAFASQPVFLFSLLALWMGVCTGIGTLFRHFRAYAGQLSGYTAAFILLAALPHPDQALHVALDRMAGIVIGVLSMSAVVALLGRRRSAREMEESLKRIHRHLLEAIPRRWDLPAEEIAQRRLRLSREYTATEALLEYADVESPGFRRRIHRLRVLTNLLLDVLDASREARQAHGIFTEITTTLEPLFDSPSEKQLAITSARLEELRTRIPEMEDAPALQAEEKLLSRWVKQLTPAGLDAIILRDPLYPDVPAAARHCVRTTLATLLACGLWKLTGWEAGPVFLMQSAASCALAATMDRPSKSLAMMSLSVLVASVAGYFCKFVLLPHANGYAEMLLCLFVVILPLASLVGSKRPTLKVIGTTSGLFLLVLIQPGSHMVYHQAHYVSFALACILGTLFNFLIFSLILPTIPAREGARLLERLEKIAQGNATRQRPPSLHTWRMTAQDLLLQLQKNPGTTPAELEEGLRLMDLGTRLLNARETNGNIHPG